MRKLSLEIDDLQVDSFETGLGSDRRGTVRGHDTRVTEFCMTPYSPCKPTTGCPTRVATTCARQDDEENR
ncbi:MAG: pinensin family lanthipeptide [Gemmatimonadetes bacterium]|nr:pinensin family lanthipeptide [Gemmatimonadota bacterium]